MGFLDLFGGKGKYREHLESLEFAESQLRLSREARFESYRSLKAAHLLRGSTTLLKGTVDGSEIELKAGLAGTTFEMLFEARGAFPAGLDAYTSKGDARVLGMNLPAMRLAPVVSREGLTVHVPEGKAPGPEQQIWDRLQALLNLKPRVMNMSPQIGDFWAKKLAIEKDRARLTDYGLIRDGDYLVRLMKEFAGFVELWKRFNTDNGGGSSSSC